MAHAATQPATTFPLIYVHDEAGELALVDCPRCGSRGVNAAGGICACAAGLAFRIDGAFLFGVDVAPWYLAEPPLPRPLIRLRDGKRVGQAA